MTILGVMVLPMLSDCIDAPRDMGGDGGAGKELSKHFHSVVG